MPYRDHDYDDLDAREYPDPDLDGNGAELIRCPNCRAWTYENAEWCPTCGDYITTERLDSRQPWWVVAAAILLLIVILMFWI